MLKPGYKLTDLGVLPEDWEVKELGELGECIIGLTYNPANIDKSGTLVLRSSNIQEDELDLNDQVRLKMPIPEKLLVQEDDLLVCVRNGSRRLIGKCLLLDQRVKGASFGAFMSIYRSPLNKYVVHAFKSNIIAKQIEENLGATINSITNKDLNAYKIPLPPPSEQKAIAEALGKIDALLTSQKQLLAKKRALKLATQQALLSGERRLPGFAGEWEELSLIDFVRLSKKRMNPQITTVSYRCIEMEHIAPESGALISFTDSKLQASIKSIFEPGDVLFGKLRPYLRKYYLASFSGVCSTEFWVIKPLENSVSAYIYQLVQGDRFVEAANQTTGTKMPRANWSDMKELTFFLPALAEQRAIAAFLSNMDAEIEALAAQVAKTQALKQGMMQDLLTGTIRLRAGEAALSSPPTL